MDDDERDLPSRRHRGLEPLSGLVRGRFGGRHLPWERVVGSVLAEGSVCVGVDGGGRLRVVARNDATRREIALREVQVLGIYNVEAERLGRPLARSLLCFVGDGRSFRGDRARPPRRPAARAETAPAAAPDPEAVAAIDALGLRVPPATRDALARVLAGRRARAADKQRDSDAQG